MPAVTRDEMREVDRLMSWANQAFVYGAPDYTVPKVDIARIDRELTEGAQQYLARAKEGLGTQLPTETMVLHGPPADALIDLVEAQRIDLEVVASHTRGALARAVLGSVGDGYSMARRRCC